MLDNSESFPIELDTRATRSYLTKLENSPRSLTYTYTPCCLISFWFLAESNVHRPELLRI